MGFKSHWQLIQLVMTVTNLPIPTLGIAFSLKGWLWRPVKYCNPVTVLIGYNWEFTLIAFTGSRWSLFWLCWFGGNCKEYLGFEKYPSSFTAHIGTSSNPEILMDKIQYGTWCLKFNLRPPYVFEKIFFSYFSTKTYVVGAQKNRLNETVLLGTQNIWLEWWVRK